MSKDGGPSTTPGPAAGPSTARDRTTGLDAEALEQINHLTLSGTFVSSVAHELNNPLQVIRGLAELMSERSDLPADAQTKIGKIGAHAERAAGVIREILSFVRDEGTERARLDLREICTQALGLRRYPLGRIGVTPIVDVEPGPAPIVVCNARQVRQALLNLIVNAEYALAGRDTPVLVLRIWREGSRIRVSVKDNGPGVPAALREQIFEPFFTTKGTDRAAGLGLTVASSIVRRHGGALGLTEGGEGAEFVMDWPAA